MTDYAQLYEKETGKKVLNFPYVYTWKNNEKRASLYGRKLKVLVRGIANSALVEFEDGEREVISRNAIRKHNQQSHE